MKYYSTNHKAPLASLHEAVVDIRVPADIPVVAALEAAGFPSAQEGWIGL